MLLTNLTLDHFRSYNKEKFIFKRQLIIIIGPNTSGKTNILEAIFSLAVGKSFRAEKDSEMISFGQSSFRISAEIESFGEKNNLEMVLAQGEFPGRKFPIKRYFQNGVSKRLIDFVGNLKVCLFWPQDIELIIDSPSIRRKYLDFTLTQVDREYLRHLRIYERALRSRNKLLENIREGQASSKELIYWNKLLIDNGSYLNKVRGEYLDFFNKRHFSIGNNIFKVFYDQSSISEERLAQYSEAEIGSATTLVGPHRDDFKIRIMNYELRIKDESRDLSIFGSRGEQRLGVLWLKLGELAYLKTKSNNDDPILLLDDIFSEFDHHNRRRVFEHIGDQQTIITTTDIHLIEEKLRKQAQIIQLK